MTDYSPGYRHGSDHDVGYMSDYYCFRCENGMTSFPSLECMCNYWR